MAKSTKVWGVGVLVAVLVGSFVSTGESADPPLGQGAAESPKPAKAPLVAPRPGFASDKLPTWAANAPPFPFLPQEDASVSRSVGTVTDGYLVNSVLIPSPHPFLAILPIQNKRHLNHTSAALLALVEAGATYVDSAFPGSPLYLGNFSAQGGGDIPYSVSHNSGRDGDVAFYVLNEDGQPVEPVDLVPLDENGEYRSEDGLTFYRFDTARNWAFIEGLVKHDSAHIQYVFVSDPLKQLLLAHAEESGASADVVAQANRVLWQPKGALPHDDHFHIRIYCSEADVAAGCQNTGGGHAGLNRYGDARRKSLAAAREATKDEDAEIRTLGIRRLSVMGDRTSKKVIVARLSDESPSVRAAAVRALGELGIGSAEIAASLKSETHPSVRLEMVATLGTVRSKKSANALSEALSQGDLLAVDGVGSIDERAVVADALLNLEDAKPVGALVEALPKADAGLQERLVRALRVLTNQPLTTPDEWTAWYKANRKARRSKWLLAGFKEAGYPVKRLSIRSVWDLCRAIEGPDHVSHNAQRELMRLAKREVPSLEWSKADAYFYWRRWFERRTKRYGAPPIPDELSTLKGEQN